MKNIVATISTIVVAIVNITALPILVTLYCISYIVVRYRMQKVTPDPARARKFRDLLINKIYNVSKAEEGEAVLPSNLTLRYSPKLAKGKVGFFRGYADYEDIVITPLGLFGGMKAFKRTIAHEMTHVCDPDMYDFASRFLYAMKTSLIGKSAYKTDEMELRAKRHEKIFDAYGYREDWRNLLVCMYKQLLD